MAGRTACPSAKGQKNLIKTMTGLRTGHGRCPACVRVKGRDDSLDVLNERPPRIPDRGDIPPSIVANRLGSTLPEFEAWRHELERRGFPGPDETTGRYCIEAVDRWRLRRMGPLADTLDGFR